MRARDLLAAGASAALGTAMVGWFAVHHTIASFSAQSRLIFSIVLITYFCVAFAGCAWSIARMRWRPAPASPSERRMYGGFVAAPGAVITAGNALGHEYFVAAPMALFTVVVFIIGYWSLPPRRNLLGR